MTAIDDFRIIRARAFAVCDVVAKLLFLSITVMLTSFIIKSLVVLVKFKLLRDERLEYTSNKNIDEMYDLMNAKEEILIRHHKQMLALHLSLLIFVLFIAYIY